MQPCLTYVYSNTQRHLYLMRKSLYNTFPIRFCYEKNSRLLSTDFKSKLKFNLKLCTPFSSTYRTHLSQLQPYTHKYMQIPFLIRLLFVQMETITVNHNWAKYREPVTVGCPDLVHMQTKLLHLRFRECPEVEAKELTAAARQSLSDFTRKLHP